jgi:hypothetical protein
MTVERTFCYSCTRHMPTEGGQSVADARGRVRFRCACCRESRRTRIQSRPTVALPAAPAMSRRAGAPAAA